MKTKLMKTWAWLIALFLKSPAEVPADPISEARKEPDYDWQYLVTKGHVIFARLNNLAFIGKRLFAALIVAGLLLFFGTSYSAMLTLEALNSGVLGRTLEQNAYAEYESMSDAERAESSKPDFQIDLVAIQRASTDFDLNSVAEDLSPILSLYGDYLRHEVDHLNKHGKPANPCYKSKNILKQWNRNGEAVYALCNTLPETDDAPRRIWLYAITVDSQNKPKPWIGVFVEDSKWFGLKRTWAYKSVIDENNILMRHPAADKIEEINIDWLKNTLNKDFEDLPTFEAAARSKTGY